MCVHARTHAYRVIDSPHQDAQHRVTSSENLHLLLHKVLLFRLPLGRQGAGGNVGRRHGALRPVCAPLRGLSATLLYVKQPGVTCSAAAGVNTSCPGLTAAGEGELSGIFSL